MIVLNLLQKRFSRSFAKIARSGSERPTKYIYLLILIFIGLFMQAYIHNYNIVYLALFFTFAFSFSGYFFGRRNIRALHVELLSRKRIFANTISEYTLVLSAVNKNDIYDITCKSIDESKHIKIIPSSTPQVLHFNHLYKKRGDEVFGEVTCESEFALPHQVFYKVFDLESSFVIYPEISGVSLESFIAKNVAMQGERDDFEGIKSFESSDRASQIYWPSLAKGNTLMSKQFSYTNETRTLHFDFESCASSDEKRLSQLTLWVLECEKKDLDFSVYIASKTLESKKMEIDEILTFFARY